MILQRDQPSRSCAFRRISGARSSRSDSKELAPANLFEVREKDDVFLAGDAWADLEFDVALGSGAVVHVCSPEDCPVYVQEESAGSCRGQEFLGDGGTIPNLGQKSLNLSDDGRNVQSVFQIAAVTRSLMSVVALSTKDAK